MSSAHIICFGHEEILLKTRQWMLERHFRVDLATDLHELAELAGQGRVDLMILCHSLSEAECRQAVEILHGRSTEAKVLVLGTARSTECAQQGELLNFAEGPGALVRRATELLTAVAPHS